jgi:hypothetical protein
MRLRCITGTCARLALALLLLPAASPLMAQVGPLTTQSLFFDQGANAPRGNYVELEAGLVYSDNIYLEHDGPGDTLAMVGVQADTSHVGSRLDYRLDSDLFLVHYLKGEFQTQPFGYADGSGDIKIVPGLFSWTARETYNQAVLAPNLPITPDNLEAINYITTGPRFMLRPTLRTTVIVDGIYSYIDTSSQSPEYVNISNHRYGADITVAQAFSNSLSAYVTGDTQKVFFNDTQINTDFREDDISAGLKVADARTTVDLAAGYTKLHEVTDVSIDSIIGVVERPENQAPSGVNWRVELARLISPTQRVSLHTIREITDAANLFRLNIDQPVPTTVPTQIVSGQPFRYTEYGASWRLQESRTSLQIDLEGYTQRYQNQPAENNDVKLIDALVTRKLNPALSIELGGSYERNDYQTRSNDTFTALTSLRWTVGQRVALRFILSHYGLSPHGYSDNQVGVIASYAVLPGTTTGQPGGAPAGLQPGLQPGALQPNAPMSSIQPFFP